MDLNSMYIKEMAEAVVELFEATRNESFDCPLCGVSEWNDKYNHKNHCPVKRAEAILKED